MVGQAGLSVEVGFTSLCVLVLTLLNLKTPNFGF